MSSVFASRASVARSISEHLPGVSVEIGALASGLVEPSGYMPLNEGQYWQFRRYMHDILCFSLIDNGTFRDQSFNINKLGLQTNNTRINTQKPDLYTMTLEGVHLGEVSITYNVDFETERKRQRYSELVEFISGSGHECRLDVLILDLTDPEWQESFPAMSPLFVSMLEDFMSCLRIIHSNPIFSSVRAGEVGVYNTSRMQYVLENETLVDQVFKATGYQSDPDRIKSRLEGVGKDHISDEEYISRVATSILNKESHPRPFPEPRPIDPATMVSEFSQIFSSKPTTHKIPKILQLGCPAEITEEPLEFEEAIHQLRTSGKSGGYLDHVLNSLEIKSVDEERMIRLALSSEQQDKEQLEGPGRKAYLKRNGMKINRGEPKHIGMIPEHESMLEEFITTVETKITGSLLELPTPDIETCGIPLSVSLENTMVKIQQHKASSILMFYQLISNEIVLNSMRRRKPGSYVLGYSGVSGVYFLIAPGPQLRTESNVEFVKVISTAKPLASGLCADWMLEGDHWESKWLSVDVDRLKHWQRAFDRVSTSLLANAERLVRPGTPMNSAVKEEMSVGNYTFLALTYLENKQMTSVCNQTIRYLWMKSLGDKQFKGLASKFPSRCNSILQSTMLQRAVRSCQAICRMSLTDLVKVKKLHRDSETGLYDETTTGITSLLPRIFTFGSVVPISYNLNEIYWCMAYNKDRQNAGQDSLRILEKIVKEEDKYDKEINSRESKQKMNYFLGHTSVSEDIHHIFTNKPESHYYSSKAVRCGIRLQDCHHENVADGGSWMNSQRLEAILSKPLSDYATFKASVKSIADQVNPNDLSEVKKIGVRTKAIELVAEILENEELMTASEVAMKYSGQGNKDFKIMVQIFKKGQIGGVREIIILFIKARIMMNIMEEVARLLCKSDKREILTKGRDKRLMMRGDHEEVTSGFAPGTPLQVVKESYDMTVWCQKFIPIIFSHIHNHHFKDHPGMQALATHVFLAHSNKEVEYPRKLVEQWILHREAKHQNLPMQKVKEKFLSDGKPSLTNHSNMCQGIPHYNSSVLGLSCVSLRDALFKECLEQSGQECHIKWKTRLGSDDKGTLIAINLSEPTGKAQAKLLGQCERASERLHCMELSIKSASGNVMYELNSAYMANLETLSPTIKFSLAATDSIETASCSTFVSESYSRIRQMRENGCSSFVCQYAHMLNSRHFYTIFGTGVGGPNDVKLVFGLPHWKIPYDFGIYPMYDADLQDIIGPEFHNYRIIKNHHRGNDALKLLYTELSRRENEELFRKEEDDLLKKDHFGIQQGLVSQLANMRDRTNSNPEEVEEYFEKNPFLIIRGPETSKEALMLVKSKLFTKGAAQALRRTSPAIYIGRLSAYRSAKAWTLVSKAKVGFDMETGEDVINNVTSKVTYSEYLRSGIQRVKEKEELDIAGLRDVLFPQHRSLDVVEQLCGQFGALKSTDQKYSQSVRMWTVNNFNYEYTTSLRSILQTSFSLSHESPKEDVEEFKKLVGMKMESLGQFIEECKYRGIRPLDMFFYLTRLHKLSKSSRMQVFANGPSSQSLHITALNLKRYNHFPGMVSMLDAGVDEQTGTWANTMASKVDKVKVIHNLILMRETGRLTFIGANGLSPSTDDGDLYQEVQTILRNTRSISGFDNTTQKSMKLAAAYCLPEREFRDKLIEWKDLNYTYVKRQRKTVSKSGNITWSGDLEVLVSSGNECFMMCESGGRRFLKSRRIIDTHVLFTSMRSMCKILGMELQSFFRREKMDVGSIYMSDTIKMLHTSEIRNPSGNVLQIDLDKRFKFRRVVDMIDFKVIKHYDEKHRALSVHLEAKDGKTATVCHSLGNYYPVELPPGFDVSGDVFYQGVRLSSLMRNKDWFFNHRLPTMSEYENIQFLKNDVDFQTVLSLDTTDRNRITNYIEVREEVNEESFSLMASIGVLGVEDEFDDQGGRTFSEIFKEAMEHEVNSGGMKSFARNVDNWADEVEDEESRSLDFLDMLADEQTVLVTRAFGYKQPKQKKAAFTISSLQQGAELKNRIMDSFFRLSNVRSEPTRALPGYITWLNEQKTGDEEDDVFNRLCDALISHMAVVLSEATGANASAIVETLKDNSSKVMKTPLRVMYNFVSREETFTNDDIMRELHGLAEGYQSEASDDEDLY